MTTISNGEWFSFVNASKHGMISDSLQGLVRVEDVLASGLRSSDNRGKFINWRGLGWSDVGFGFGLGFTVSRRLLLLRFLTGFLSHDIDSDLV